MDTHIIDQENALDFILGGNALFTVKSLRTGKRITYKVIHDCNRPGMLEVYYLNGPDNTRNYKFIGEIYEGKIPILHIFEKKSVHDPASHFDYIFSHLCNDEFMPSLEIWHEGRCCRCGRPLTVPESIEAGIGPECMKKLS